MFSKKLIATLIGIFLLASQIWAAQVLTFDKFVQTTVQNHPQYQVAVKEYLAAIEANKSANSLEDWNLIASTFLNEASPAPISTFSSTYQKTLGYSVGTEKYFAGTGTGLKIEHSNTRINAEYPPAMAIPGVGTFDFNPPPTYYISDLSISISQPLLRNAFGLITKKSLLISDYSLLLAQIKLSEDWEDFIAKLRNEYLAWQECHINVKLYEEKVKTAEEQLDLVKRQAKYGLSEDLDLVQTKQKVEAYKIMLEQAKMACLSQDQKIISLMNITGGSKNDIAPEAFNATIPTMGKANALDYLTNNSNIRQTTDLMVAIQTQNLEIVNNQQLMDLNLVLQAKPNGFADKAADSLTNIGEYNDYTISLSASRPLANEKANADGRKANEEYEKALKQKEAALLSAKTALATLYTNLDFLTKIIDRSEASLKLAEQRLALEKKKFRQGRSSVFFVLQAEDDLLQATNQLNSVLFSREKIVNQIKSMSDEYLVEYKDILKI